MASSSKRAHLALETPDTTEESSSEDSDFSDDEEIEDEDDDLDLGDDKGKEIKVEFEARVPEARDFHGIVRMLSSMFKQPHTVNVTELVEYIINQRNVGSIITQSNQSPEEESDDDEDDFDADCHNSVFGVNTVVHLSKENKVTKPIIDYLVDSVSKGPPENLVQLSNLLTDKANKIGFLISSRIMNIPPQISVPLYETLFNEIRKAKAKKFPFDFNYFFLLTKQAHGIGGSDEILFTNAEEEVILEKSLHSFDCKFNEEICPPKMISWNDTRYEEKYKVLVFSADKCDEILSSIRNSFPLHTQT